MVAVPSIDISHCHGWTEQDVNLYNSLPFYFAKMQVERRAEWMTWGPLVGRMRWTPNMGPIMRGVRKEPSPHLRQFAMPNEISVAPKVDIMDVREVTVDAQVRRQRFRSPVLTFVPDFRDFMTNHVESNRVDIMEKMERFEDIFIRSNIFHQAPFTFVPDGAGAATVAGGNWDGLGNFDPAADGKTTGFLQNVVSQIGQPGNLNLTSLNFMLNILETDMRVPSFMGSDLPKENVGLTGKYCLICSTEAYNQFTFDPYLQAQKNCSLDVVHKLYKGDFFGRITAKLEDMPLRFKNDGTFPAPEIRTSEGESLPNPEYVSMDPTNGSPNEVAFIVGRKGYDAIEVGPPPKAFTSGEAPPEFQKMFWNGEVRLTKKFLVPCTDEEGNQIQDMNEYGEFLKFIAQATYGIVGKQRRNIIPIVFKRKRGATDVSG